MADGPSFYDQIKSFIPTAAATALGAATGGVGGALAAGGGAAEAGLRQQGLESQQSDKLISLMSLIEDRKQRQAQQQMTLEERRQHDQETLEERRRQDDLSNQIKNAQLEEKKGHDAEWAMIMQQNADTRSEIASFRASSAGRAAAGPARFDAAVSSLAYMSGGDPAEIGLKLSKAGISATGATYVAARMGSLMREGKKPTLDQIVAAGEKTKSQYDTILNNLGKAMEDKKAEGAKAFGGAAAYGNYLIANAKLFGLPPKERASVEKQIRSFAAASVAAGDDEKSAPTMDDLAKMIQPGADEDVDAKGASAAGDTLPATKVTTDATAASSAKAATPTTGTSKSGKPIYLGDDGKWHYGSAP